MTKLEYQSLLDTVLHSLRSVSQSTENLYLKLGETYRSLVLQLDGMNRNSSLLWSQKDLFLQRVGTLSSLLSDQESLLKGGEKVEALYTKGLDSLQKELDSLARCTGELEEDSEAMELISLNALVVASKAGQAGKGFAAITTELQGASLAIKELSRSLSGFARDSRKQFLELLSRQTSVQTQELEVLEKFRFSMQQVMDGVQVRIQELLEKLETLDGRRSSIKTPLFGVVVEIQNQDAIRQSIDHVILSLGELGGWDSGDTPEELLDTLSFLEILPDLSIQVLNEIIQKLSDNQRVFSSLVEQAQSTIEALEAEQKTFIHNFLLGAQGQGISREFSDLKDLADTFLRHSESSLRDRKAARQKTEGLLSKISYLSDTLGLFDEILSRFRNIDVASRIQVARYRELAAMKDNAQEMSRITRKIQEDVSATAQAARGFTLEINNFLDQDREFFDSRIRQDAAFLSGLKTSIHQLEESREGLAGEVRDKGLFTTGFLNTFAGTKDELAELGDLCRQMEEQQSRFRDMLDHIRKEKRQRLAEMGLQTWVLHNDKLRSMVERFTIFTHKQIAAELGSFQIQAGAASGDVTLF